MMNSKHVLALLFSLLISSNTWAEPKAIEFYLTPKDKVGELSKEEKILKRKRKEGSLPEHWSARVYDVDSDGTPEYILFVSGAWGPNSRCIFYHYDEKSDHLEEIVNLDLFEFYEHAEYFEATFKAGRSTWGSNYYPKTLFQQPSDGDGEVLVQTYNKYDMETDESTCTYNVSPKFKQWPLAKQRLFVEQHHLKACALEPR